MPFQANQVVLRVRGETVGLSPDYCSGNSHIDCGHIAQSTGQAAVYTSKLTDGNFPGTDDQKINTLVQCDSLMGVQVPTNFESDALTTYVNEACDQVHVLGADYVDISATPGGAEIMDLKRYMGRPYLYSQGVFNDVARGLKLAVAIDRPFFVSMPYYNRMAGCFGYKCTWVFRLQVASNPFQAGVIRLVWQPEQTAAAGAYPRWTTTTQVSQLPGVELDINEQTSCVLKVPWVCSRNMQTYASTNVVDQFGVLAMYTYLPLTVASGSPAPAYSLWVHVEDLELFHAAPESYSLVTPQGGEDADQAKPLSSLLLAVSKVSTSVGRLIPSISSIAVPATWVLAQSSRLASSYGYAKPQTTIAPTRMLVMNHANEQNSNGAVMTSNHGLFMDNQLTAQPGFAGNDVDEMSFEYVISRMCCIAAGSLSSGDAAGLTQIKYSCLLTPMAMWFQGANNLRTPRSDPPATTSANTGNAFLPTPLLYIANTFVYWRGGFHFRFKIAKTKFHTGRLLFAFQPVPGLGDYVSPSTTQSLAATNPLTMQFKSWVWDLREGNVFDVKIPWTASLDYYNMARALGYLHMYILDPLTGPSTVSPTVPFNVEVCALPGFEFHVPITPNYPPAPLINNVIFAQSGAEYVFGEHVLSIKQLISKACGYCVGGQGTSPSQVTIPTWYNWDTNFLWQGVTQQIASSGLVPKVIPHCHYFARLYAYARGGTNIHIPTNPVGIVSAVFTGDDAFEVTGPRSSNSIYMSATSGIHVRMPFSNTSSRSLISGTGPTQSDNQTLITFGTTTTPGTPIFIAAADDAQLGYFLGAMPLCFNSTAAVGTPVLRDDTPFMNSIY